MEAFDEVHELANLTLALRNAGYVNVEEVKRVYDLGRMEGEKFINTVWLEYLHSDGTLHTDPLDTDLTTVHNEAYKLEQEQDAALAESLVLTDPPE